MKTFLLALLMSIPSALFAQQNAAKDTVYNGKDVDKSPEYPGGNEEWLKHLSHNIRYPKEAREKGIEGMVVLQLIVNENGSISNLHVIKSVGGGCDEEAMRMVDTKKKCSPGIKDGNPVKCYVVVPIKFKLGTD